jgi:hypothetical protein
MSRLGRFDVELPNLDGKIYICYKMFERVLGLNRFFG